MELHRQRRFKLAATLVLVGTAAGVLSLSAPELEYSRTIFGRLPLEAVIALFLGCTLAFFSALLIALNGVDPYREVGVLLLGYLVYFSLPKQAGVVLYGGHASDILVHIGIARSILNSGVVPPSDWYPLVHIQLALFGEVTRAPIPAAQRIFPVLYLLLFALGLGLLARELVSGPQVEWIAFLLGLPMIFAELNGTFHPSMVAFFMFPLFAYSFLQSGRAFDTATLSLGVALSLMHPLASLTSIGFAFIFLLADGVLEDGPSPITLFKNKAAQLLLLSLVWSSWFFSFDATSLTIAEKLGLLSKYTSEGSKTGSGGGEGIIAIYLQALGGETSLGVLVDQALQQYAPMLMYAVSTCFGLVILVTASRRRSRSYTREAIVLTAVSFVGVLVSIPYFLTDLVIGNPIRAGRWSVIGAILVVGLASVSKKSSPPFVRYIMILFIISSVPLGMYATDTENQHIREQTLEGGEWQLSYRNANVPTKSQSLTSNLNIYLRGPYGPSPLNHALDNQTLERPVNMPKNRSLSASYECSYLVASAYDVEYHRHLSQQRKQGLNYLTSEDIDRIESSPTIDQIYTNGAMDIWKGC